MRIGDGLRQSVGLFRHFLAAYPGRSALMLLALTTAALAEGVGVAALLPVIGLAIGSEGAGGVLTVHAERLFALLGLNLSLGALLALVVAAITLKSLLTLLAMAQVGYSAAHVAADLRLALVRALMEARWTHFVDRRAGELASAADAEPTRAANAYVASCRVLSGGIQLLVYLALSVAISWRVLAAALVVGALGVAVSGRLVAVSRRAGQNQTGLRRSFMVRLLQALDGMKTLKAMALEENARPLIEGDVSGLNKALRTVVVSREALAESYEILRVFAVAGGLYAFVAVWSQPVEGLLVLALLFVRALQKAGQLQGFYQAVAADQPAFAFVRSEIAAAEAEREPGLGRETPRLASAISLGDVSFSYGRETVLDGVSMTLPVGSFIAVVGSSGAGKTTVADLVIGLLRPQSGEVWIDGPAHARHRHEGVARHGRLCAAGDVPVPRHGRGQRRARRTRDVPRQGRDGAAPRRSLGFRRRAAGRHGHRGGRAGGAAFRRSAPAHRHRPGAGPRSRAADSGRGHHRARPGDGSGHRGHGPATGRRDHRAVDFPSAAMREAADVVYRLDRGRAVLDGADDPPARRAGGGSFRCHDGRRQTDEAAGLLAVPPFLSARPCRASPASVGNAMADVVSVPPPFAGGGAKRSISAPTGPASLDDSRSVREENETYGGPALSVCLMENGNP